MANEQDYQQLEARVVELEKILALYKEHTHLGVDGSRAFDGRTDFVGKSLLIGGGVATPNRLVLPIAVADGVDQDWLKPGGGQRTTGSGLLVKQKGESNEELSDVALISKPGKAFTTEPDTPSNRIDWEDSAQAITRLIVQPNSEAALSGPSVFGPLGFFVGERTPNCFGRATISTGGSTLTDANAVWATDAMVGCIAAITGAGGNVIEAYMVLANTAQTLTLGRFLANGAAVLASFEADTGEYDYTLRNPILMGEAGMPYARVYAGEDIRLGYGSSGGSQVRYIKWGVGSPEGVVTANIGSIYLDFEGGSGSTLYIKESGNGLPTGWDAK